MTFAFFPNIIEDRNREVLDDTNTTSKKGESTRNRAAADMPRNFLRSTIISTANTVDTRPIPNVCVCDPRAGLTPGKDSTRDTTDMKASKSIENKVLGRPAALVQNPSPSKK